MTKNTIIQDGWEYKRLTDGLTIALFEVLSQHEEEMIECSMGHKNETPLYKALLQIDRDLLDSAIINRIERENDEHREDEESRLWELENKWRR